MDDSSKEQTEPNDQETARKPSLEDTVNALHPAKPMENIAITEKTPTNSQEQIEKIYDKTPSSLLFHPTLYDTVREEPASFLRNEVKTTEEAPQPDLKLTGQPSKDAPAPINFEKPRVSSAINGQIQSERIIRNQSDIFSLKEQTSVASSIFSVNGSPSRKVFRRRELVASNVFPFGEISKEEPPSDKLVSPRDKLRDVKDSYNDLKRPSSSLRNPLTGSGLSSNDEYKFKGNKRKDGNPLLGLGYTPEVSPSTHRIPPGGFSHKLW